MIRNLLDQLNTQKEVDLKMYYYAAVHLIYFYKCICFLFKFPRLLTFWKRVKVACCTFIDRTMFKLVFKDETLTEKVLTKMVVPIRSCLNTIQNSMTTGFSLNKKLLFV